MTARPAVLGLLIICVAAGMAGSARKASCGDPVTWKCKSNVHPVCGSDGYSYGNECFLCNEIRGSKQEISIVKDGYC
ncbi:probable pancreatic secretory proteinase inhibitor [Gambusia affinis]|uniref:probable pancreatic secretory proteinase inhibitor n=1 Tax=Gambusia affinis TaxID=33528 RepID=UPI001CDC64EE|nr:probable pancreatic secretory proteinase inhibitor [Gambusia affinis]